MTVNWQKALVDAGGPILKDLIEKGVGGGIKGAIAGKLADAALQTLGELFNTQPAPEAIGRAIELDPVGAPSIVQRVQTELVSTVELGSGDMAGYLRLLESDSSSEGLLTRLWRPLFAVLFTITFSAIGFAIVFLALSRDIDTLNSVFSGATFLSFYFVAGCAVIGVQIYQREKTERVTSG